MLADRTRWYATVIQERSNLLQILERKTHGKQNTKMGTHFRYNVGNSKVTELQGWPPLTEIVPTGTHRKYAVRQACSPSSCILLIGVMRYKYDYRRNKTLKYQDYETKSKGSEGNTIDTRSEKESDQKTPHGQTYSLQSVLREYRKT